MEQTRKKAPLSFPEFYAKESPMPFYVLVTLFVISNMLLVIYFTPEVSERVYDARRWINTAILWLCPMYFALNLILWRMKPWTIAVGVGAIAAVFALWNFLGQYTELFCTAVAAMLALMAYKRDFKVVLKIFMAAHLAMILIAMAGLKLGYALPTYKLGTEDVGVSLGLIYPNHLARLSYIAMTIAWYLWGQKRRVLTTAIFWTVAVVMWVWVKCRTITIFMVAFPLCWWATMGLLAWKRSGRAWNALHKVWNSIMIGMPFVMFVVTYILGKFRVFLDSLSTFGTGLYSMLMRFISAGILFDAFKFPLWGRNIQAEDAPMEFINGKIYMAGIIDNSYVYYFICFGVIVMALALAWLCVANWRAIRSGDHALLLIAVFMLVYGLIEVVTFQFEHNFMWFYPLTASALAAEAGKKHQLMPQKGIEGVDGVKEALVAENAQETLKADDKLDDL